MKIKQKQWKHNKQNKTKQTRRVYKHDNFRDTTARWQTP